jgi:Rhodopirellula transposase DDE domain
MTCMSGSEGPGRSNALGLPGELVGDFKNAGRTWQPKGQPIQVQVHDFPSMSIGRAVPYGIYDVGHNRGSSTWPPATTLRTSPWKASACGGSRRDRRSIPWRIPCWCSPTAHYRPDRHRTTRSRRVPHRCEDPRRRHGSTQAPAPLHLSNSHSTYPTPLPSVTAIQVRRKTSGTR